MESKGLPMGFLIYSCSRFNRCGHLDICSIFLYISYNIYALKWVWFAHSVQSVILARKYLFSQVRDWRVIHTTYVTGTEYFKSYTDCIKINIKPTPSSCLVLVGDTSPITSVSCEELSLSQRRNLIRVYSSLLSPSKLKVLNDHLLSL